MLSTVVLGWKAGLDVRPFFLHYWPPFFPHPEIEVGLKALELKAATLKELS